MYILRISMEPGFLRLKFADEGYPNVWHFSCLATCVCTKNLYYYLKRDWQSSLPNSIS